MPPDCRQRAANQISEYIERVTRDREDSRADDFKKNAPHSEMKTNLADCWWCIVVAETQPPLQPKHEWQSTRDEQQVIKLTVQEFGRHMRLESPAIKPVKSATQQEQRIPPVAEALHKAVMMTAPANTASRSLPIKIMPQSKLTVATRKALRCDLNCSTNSG